MRFNFSSKLWLVCLPLVVVAMMSAKDFVQAQQDDLCYLETVPGRRTPLSKICGKSEEREMDDEMWDENNYDPNFVERNSYGVWVVREGGRVWGVMELYESPRIAAIDVSSRPS